MTATTLVGHVVLLAIGRSPTPAPWSLEDEVARARKASGVRPAAGMIADLTPGELRAASTSATMDGMTGLRDLPEIDELGDTARSSPPPLSAGVVYAAFYVGMAFQAARVLFT